MSARIDRSRILALVATGVADPVIARDLGCSKQYVHQVRAKAGLPANTRRPIPPGEWERVLELLAGGATISAAARACGVKPKTVTDRLYRDRKRAASGRAT